MKSTVLIAGPSSSRGKDAIRNLIGFMRLQARLEANKPTFAKFLGVSVAPTETSDGNKDANVREDRFSFSDRSNIGQQQQHQSLVFRYRFPPNDRFRLLDEGHNEKDRTIQDRILRAHHRGGPSLSTYTSILDEVTTMAIISAAPKKYPRFGVSVTMQSQWGPGVLASSRERPPLKEVDIITTITKLGRTLGFVRAEVRDPNDNSLICYFDHIKYMPTGWMMGILLTPVGMWCLDLFLQYSPPYLKNGSSNNRCEAENSYDGIMDSFRKTSNTTATFQFGLQHSNGIGGLHGGVQAILMERLGRIVAQNELLKLNSNSSTSNNIHDVECERLQVSYQSSASKVLEIRAHVIDPPRVDRHSITLRVEILRGQKSSDGSNNDTGNPKQSKRVVVSEGVLTFINTSPKSKDT